MPSVCRELANSRPLATNLVPKDWFGHGDHAASPFMPKCPPSNKHGSGVHPLFVEKFMVSPGVMLST